MRSLLPRWRPWFSRYSTFSRNGFTQLTIHPDAIPLTAFCTHNGLNEWLCMPQGTASVPACFVCVMLLTAAHDMIQMSLEGAIGSDDSPINYVATLAAFLSRLRPHKSDLSPNKTRSESRESNSWVTSSLKMVSNLMRTESPPCLACLCMRTFKQLRSLLDGLTYYLKPQLRTSNSPCLTWPGAYARLRPCSSHKRKRRLRSPCGIRNPIDP